jgi:hypothetical protein
MQVLDGGFARREILRSKKGSTRDDPSVFNLLPLRHYTLTTGHRSSSAALTDALGIISLSSFGGYSHFAPCTYFIEHAIILYLSLPSVTTFCNPSSDITRARFTQDHIYGSSPAMSCEMTPIQISEGIGHVQVGDRAL